MRNRIAIGLDRGFGGTKYHSDIVDGHIDSLVAPISEIRAKEIINNNINDKDVIVVKVDGKYYLVGSYVALVEPNYAERDLKRNRDGLNETILFLTGMGLASGELEDVEMVITTGLPTDDYDKYKNQYATKILNNNEPYIFEMFRCGNTYSKNITVIKANVENQPKGTIISVINEKLARGENWNLIKNQKFGVCDIGFNTSDLSMYVGKDIVQGEKINFSTFAMVQIVSTVKKIIEEELKCKKTEDEILEAMKTGKVKIRGKFIDCYEQIKKGFDKNAELLINEITSKWEDYLDRLDEMILTGGTLENNVFKQILVEYFDTKIGWEISVPAKPQYANALGFYLISASILQKM